MRAVGPEIATFTHSLWTFNKSVKITMGKRKSFKPVLLKQLYMQSIIISNLEEL